MAPDPFLGPYRDIAALQARARRILGVDDQAGLADIKAAFRRLARQQHPDLGGSEEDFTRTVNAYLILTKPDPLRYPLPSQEGNTKTAPLSDEEYLLWWLQRFGS